jgi:hypothetical protein
MVRALIEHLPAFRGITWRAAVRYLFRGLFGA